MGGGLWSVGVEAVAEEEATRGDSGRVWPQWPQRTSAPVNTGSSLSTWYLRLARGESSTLGRPEASS